MTSPLSCGCKGTRFCSLCQSSDRIKKLGTVIKPEDALLSSNYSLRIYCLACDATYAVSICMQEYLNSDFDILKSLINSDHMNGHENNPPLRIKGIFVRNDFITETEEVEIMDCIDCKAWVNSQSGRRKQDYGPKVNFKHKKVKVDAYKGLPQYADMLLDKMSSVAVLEAYTPFEMCNLEYTAERGSRIDLHQDDMWIWGERLISINLLSAGVMTLVNDTDCTLVAVPMPRRSLLCMYSDVRWDWKHGILPCHVISRRIALTMREPGADFMHGPLFEQYGSSLIECSKLRVPKGQ